MTSHPANGRPSGAGWHQWRPRRRRGGEARGLEAGRGPGRGGRRGQPELTGPAGPACVGRDPAARHGAFAPEYDCFAHARKRAGLISGRFFRFWALTLSVFAGMPKSLERGAREKSRGCQLRVSY